MISAEVLNDVITFHSSGKTTMAVSSSITARSAQFAALQEILVFM